MMEPSMLPGAIAADREFFERAAAWNDGSHGSAELTVATLRAISELHGIELATAILHDRTRRSALHGDFIRRVESRISITTPLQREVHVGVVPGAMWAQYPHTGADGQWIMRILSGMGVSHERVEVPGFGSLEENGQAVLDWLDAHRDRQVMLVSLSKGGPDVKVALRMAPERFEQVGAWVSVCGSMQGSPLVRWLNDRPMRKLGLQLLLKLRGAGLNGVDDLRREPGAPLWEWPAVPSHLKLTHVMSFPLRHHLAHPWAVRGYERAVEMGPNDGGGILLGDVLGWPGVVYPVWGADHYLRPSWDAAPLLRAIFAEALAGFPAQMSAASPRATPAGRSSR